MPTEEQMLPDIQPEATPAKEETVSKDVKEPVSPKEGPTEDSPAKEEPTVPDGHVPYSRFKEEIKKRKELEEKLKSLEESETPEEDNPLSEKVSKLERELYLSKFPELSDKHEELAEFLEEKPGMELEDAVDLFKVRYGLTPERKGLEKVVAGPKEPAKPKWTVEEQDQLRKNNPRKWEKLVDEGVFDDQGW